MVLLQISPEILRMSSNRKMLGSKGILTPMIHGLLRKMATFRCFAGQ